MHRYRLTYPHIGNNIYQAESKDKAIKKCYKEFKMYSGMDNGMFSVTDLDTDIEYTYKIKDKDSRNSKRSKKSKRGKRSQKGGGNDIHTFMNSIETNYGTDIINQKIGEMSQVGLDGNHLEHVTIQDTMPQYTNPIKAMNLNLTDIEASFADSEYVPPMPTLPNL